MKEKRRKVAVFDIDGTIFRSSLLIELVEALIDEKVFSRYAKSYFEESREKWLKRIGKYEDYIADIIRVYLKYIKGTRRADVWKVADRVVKEQQNYTYRYTRDLVGKFKNKYFLLAISHSPYEMVSPFAKSLGFDKTYGQVYEVDKKVRFTGNVLYKDLIMNKEIILDRAVEKNNLTLEGSIGVGDTQSDEAFLKRVEIPIAFNPTSELYKTAKKNKWKIVVERKDMIYEL
jgi:HAD superfamily phosphoserine phosphatase-like hydrolase